jgi:hypothetical protein
MPNTRLTCVLFLGAGFPSSCSRCALFRSAIAFISNSSYGISIVNEQANSSRFEATSAEALLAAREYAGPLLVDLDETLYLRNSTEDYIDTARPAPLALLFLRVLDVIKPWRWNGGDAARDVWRVWLISILFPWTQSQWRNRVRTLGPQFRNEALARALAARGQPFTIVTLGFSAVVAPLVEAMNLGDRAVIACRLDTVADRVGGKLAIAQRAIGSSVIAEAAVISDSFQDAPLFSACKRPILVRWRNAQCVSAFRGVYLPGQYLDLIKRPRSGALKSVLVDDFPLWVLSSFPLALVSPWTVLGLAFLFVSFWAIYEAGYVENDQVAARCELEPQLTAEFRECDVSAIGPRPWIYAVCFGFLGVLSLHHASLPDFCFFAAGWAFILAGTRLYYRMYNYADKQTRAWLYLGLQSLRVGAFAAVVPLNSVGALACVARAASRWQIYLMYRKVRASSGYDWTPLPERTIALALFGMLLLFGLISGFVHISSAGLCAFILLWNGILARRELVNIVTAAHLHQSCAPPAFADAQTSRG